MSDLVVIDKDKTISELIMGLKRLESRVLELERKSVELRDRLRGYENPKNSRNSSIPPSRDENRPKKNQSHRKATGSKPGGQPGNKGNTLRTNPAPDHVVELRPDHCRACGSAMGHLPSTMERARQIVDLPPIRAVWTEYRTYGRQCGCGRRTVADFPKGVASPVSYGANIEGLIAYFHARQYLPFARMGEMMNDVMGIGIGEGGIHCLLNRFAERAAPLYETIRQRVAASKVVGADETGAKVNGAKLWFWTWQTTKLTYIAHSATR